MLSRVKFASWLHDRCVRPLQEGDFPSSDAHLPEGAPPTGKSFCNARLSLVDVGIQARKSTCLAKCRHCLQKIQKNSCRFQYVLSRVKFASWLHDRCVRPLQEGGFASSDAHLPEGAPPTGKSFCNARLSLVDVGIQARKSTCLATCRHCLQKIQKHSCRFQYVLSRVKFASWLHDRCVRPLQEGGFASSDAYLPEGVPTTGKSFCNARLSLVDVGIQARKSTCLATCRHCLQKNPEKQLSVSVCVVSCKVCKLVARSVCSAIARRGFCKLRCLFARRGAPHWEEFLQCEAESGRRRSSSSEIYVPCHM